MNVRLVYVSADHKGMIAFSKTLCKFYAQPVCFFRGNLTGAEGLAYMIGNHIICATHSSGGDNILTLSQHKLGVGHTAVALITSDESTVVGLLRVGHIVNNRADGTALGPALANMQRHDTRGRHCYQTSSEKE